MLLNSHLIIASRSLNGLNKSLGVAWSYLNDPSIFTINADAIVTSSGKVEAFQIAFAFVIVGGHGMSDTLKTPRAKSRFDMDGAVCIDHEPTRQHTPVEYEKEKYDDHEGDDCGKHRLALFGI